MSKKEAIQKAVDENFEAFQEQLPELAQQHPGRFVLMREKKVVESFDSARDAIIYAQDKFHDGLYSVQEVTDQVIDLGYFSHAMYIDPIQSGDRSSS